MLPFCFYSFEIRYLFSFLFHFSISESVVYDSYILIHQVIPQEVVGALLAACKSGNFDLANKEVNNAIAEGYPVSQMLSQV